jgi:hypothetical protein
VSHFDTESQNLWILAIAYSNGQPLTYVFHRLAMNRKDLPKTHDHDSSSFSTEIYLMSVGGATGRKFRMKQESQLVEKILRALPSIDVSSFKRD